MGKPNLSKMVGSAVCVLKKHSPEILTGMGIIGMVGTVILSVDATPKALVLMEEKKREINNDIRKAAEENGHDICQHIDKLTPVDTVKTVWRCYIPATVLCVASIGCLIGASSVNARRNAALAAAYTISETALKEYKNKVVETIGEKKTEKIDEVVAKAKLDSDPIEKKEIIITDKGDVTCYDVWSGRYFKSSMDELNRIVNELNKRMLDSYYGYISLNEFYEAVGLSATKVGNDLGWKLDGGRNLIELNFDSQIATDGTPCLVVDFDTRPVYEFDRSY